MLVMDGHRSVNLLIDNDRVTTDISFLANHAPKPTLAQHSALMDDILIVTNTLNQVLYNPHVRAIKRARGAGQG